MYKMSLSLIGISETHLENLRWTFDKKKSYRQVLSNFCYNFSVGVKIVRNSFRGILISEYYFSEKMSLRIISE